MSGKAKLDTGQLARLPRLEDARTVLLQQRRHYLTQARLKAREARTLKSFAKLELVPNTRYGGYHFKQLELERETERMRALAGAVDKLLGRFALQEGRLANES